MRICFVSRRFFPTISGMSVYAAGLLDELVRAGHDVTMVSQYRGDALGTRVYGGGPPPDVAGVKVIGLEARGEQDGGDFERDVAEMAGVVAEEHARAPFDVVHAQYGYPTGLAALEASRLTGAPNVVSIQGGDGHWVGACCATHERAMRAVLDHAGALLIGSRSFADSITGRLGTSPERFVIVPGAVDTRRFRPGGGWAGGPRFRTGDDNGAGALGVGLGGDGGAGADRFRPGDRDGPVLLYHGRVDARKGVLDLLDAMGELDGVRLVVSGVGPDLERARERVEELGLDERVELLGYTPFEDAPDVYRRGDVFVSPTYAEGFSNTILEAMASGLPIVSTRVVGVVDCLRDGDNALLVGAADPPALAAALRRVIDEPSLGEGLATRALAEVRERYAWPAVARLIEDVYERVRGTAPDVDWEDPGPPEPCRYRATPHLL